MNTLYLHYDHKVNNNRRESHKVLSLWKINLRSLHYWLFAADRSSALANASPRFYIGRVLVKLTEYVVAGQTLSADAAAEAVRALASPDVEVDLKAAFLGALASKGETMEEIVAFARELLALSVQPPLDPATRAGEILDVCGTGGDRLNTFNISTTVALIAAAAGIKVAKHGNRAITSQAGSADTLEALGIKIDLTPAEAAAALREHGFAFFFAPRYHPAVAAAGAARKLCAAKGQRTIFNFLGPLLNPARPTMQLVGAPVPALCGLMAGALQDLGLRRGMVVCGSVPPGADGKPRHLDELSTLGDNVVAEFYQTRALAVSTLSPHGFPVRPATLADLAGGDSRTNAETVVNLLQGKERGPKRDAVLLNAAAALFVAEKVKSMADGWELAEELIDSGAVLAKLEALVNHK